MLFDAQNLFSDDQAITGDAASTNVIDTGADKDVALGNPVEVNIQVTEAFNTLTSLDIKVQACAAENFGSGVVTLTSENFLLAALTVGAKASVRCLPAKGLRYLRLYYECNGTDPTEGKIHAGIVAGVQSNANG